METVKQFFISTIILFVAVLSNIGFVYAAESQQKVYYFLHDHLGGISAVTDEDGNVVERRDYLPFGEDLLDEADVTDYGFTGKEQDPETELYYYGARYYDSVTGRFISMDPWEGDLEDPQTFNKYSYTKNNPLIYTDPTGKIFFLYAGPGSDNIAKPNAIFQPFDVSTNVNWALVGQGGKKIITGAGVLSSGLASASTLEAGNIAAVMGVVKISSGISTMTFGLVDVVRGIYQENAKEPAKKIITDGITDGIAETGKKLFKESSDKKPNINQQNDSNQSQTPSQSQNNTENLAPSNQNKEPIDSWQYRYKNSEMEKKKIESKDKDK